MRSPALAIAWELRQRHRWGLIAVASYFLIVATIKLLVLEPGHLVNLDDAESFGVLVMVPLTATFMYFLAVFSFGLAGDIAARESIYPRRLFTLPVTSDALTGWPMRAFTSRTRPARGLTSGTELAPPPPPPPSVESRACAARTSDSAMV